MKLMKGRGSLLPWFVNAPILSSLFIMSCRHSRRPRKNDSTVTLTPLQSPPLHSITDIVSNVFGDILTKETRHEPTDQDTVIAIPGELEVQKDYIDVYQKKLNTYCQLEQHILQTRAKVIAEQESQLSTTKDTYPSCTNVNLLRGSSSLSQYLDEESLQAHGLLVPRDYCPITPLPQSPPHEQVTSHLRTTLTSRLHARISAPVISRSNDIKQGTTNTKPPPSWKYSLSAEDRELEKVALYEMNRKTNFLHNPRHSAHAHSNTASSGPLKIKRQKQGKEKEDSRKLFIGEPPEILFTGYLPGETYECLLELRNISGASRQLRIVPPSTPYFTASIVHFPNNDGSIAPGMSCSYNVQFMPDSLADFFDEIKVLSHIGECLVVPLKGFRPPPELSLPEVLQCGHCLVQGQLSIVFPCHNTGGEGNFRLLTQQDQDISSEVSNILTLDPFTITPTEFYLSPGNTIDIKVSFHPTEAIEYSKEFLMACDNGQVKSLVLSGIGEMVSLGCVYISPSANTLCTVLEYVKSAGYTSDMDASLSSDVIDSPVMQFDDTNPGVCVYKTAVIENFSHVHLSYQWKQYYPRTELTNQISPLVEYHTPPFNVDQLEGTLQSRETKLVTFSFIPNKTGYFRSMAYLELQSIPVSSLQSSDEGYSWIKIKDGLNGEEIQVAIMCIDLIGNAVPYLVEFLPPLFELPGDLLVCTEIRKRFKILNHSLMTVSFLWSHEETEQCKVTVYPSEGSIVSGGTSYSELVLLTNDRKGSFNLSLECTIQHSDISVILPVKGRVQGPVVTMDTPSLNFGLVRLGESVCHPLQLTNHSNCIVQYELRQLSEQKGDTIQEVELPVVDYECLVMSPSYGELSAYSSILVNVECTPKLEPGRLRTAIECLIHEERSNLLSVTAEIQRPILVLDQSSLYIEECYESIPVTYTLKLINRTHLSTHFHWINESHNYCELKFSPSDGFIDSKEIISIEVQSTWKTKEPFIRCADLLSDERHHGYIIGVMAACCVEGMTYPLLVSISAHIVGLTVNYKINGLEKESSELCLDFGSSNQLRDPHYLSLIITNTSGIPTQLSLSVKHFPANTTSHLKSNITDNSTSKPKALLQSTTNLAKRSSKTAKQRKEELITSLLSLGRGACFVVEPSQCALPPLQPVQVTITSYSDMWGDYNDSLICQVSGLNNQVIPIKYSIRSHPIYFQPTSTYGNTLIRLGYQTAGSSPIKRTIKLTNTSSCSIRLDWRVFSILSEDNKLIDLISYIGHPFPRISQSEIDVTIATEKKDPVPLIRVLLFPHEGVPSNYPFTISPQQMVLQPCGQSSVEVTFDPSIKTYNELGEQIKGYVLGYISLDDKPPVECTRQQCYQMDPVRINLTAGISHPRLNLETESDNNSLTFTHLISELLDNEQILREVTKIHHFTFTNYTDTILTFNTLPLSHPYLLSLEEIDKDNSITLQPRKSSKFYLSISLNQNDLSDQMTRDNDSSDIILLTDKLTVVYSTGATQEFPIKTTVFLPSLSIYPTLIDYETGVIGRPLTSSIHLRNSSMSCTKWNIKTPQEWLNIVQIQPQCGILSTGVDTLKVIFTPRAERHYSISIDIVDEITGHSLSFTVSGCGSANERYRKHGK